MDDVSNKLGNIFTIKSFYILKRIFSFLWKNKKLDLMAYNKQLQEKIGINIENYKNTSNKFKIAERNGIGKEYLKVVDIIIFEGEYLNGRRNGKGKGYYLNGNIRFEGEYLNGKKINGKIYDYNNDVLILNDGKIKEYYDNYEIYSKFNKSDDFDSEDISN